MIKYYNSFKPSKKHNYEVSNLEDDNLEGCCFVLGFTSLRLGISFFLFNIVNYFSFLIL